MATPSSPDSSDSRRERKRTNTVSSVAHSVQTAAAELLQKDPPTGFVVAAAGTASQAPTIGEIRRGNFGSEGWQGEGQVERRRRTLSQGSSRKSQPRRLSTREREREVVEREEHQGTEAFAVLTEEPSQIGHHERQTQAEAGQKPSPNVSVEREEQHPGYDGQQDEAGDSINTSERTVDDRIPHLTTTRKVYTSGYIPPPVVPWTTSTLIGLKAFGRWFCTPFGFLVTIYGLNVVAWGGMLFLLLCDASPAMCWAPIHVPGTAGHHSLRQSLALNSKYPRYHNCNDINSPRRVWLEIDSQILNALFCVTGFGLIPWRFRDLWYLLQWRLTSEKRSGRERKQHGLRVLAGIYRGWFRLPDSHTLDQLSFADYQRTLPSSPVAASASNNAQTPTDLEAGGDHAEIDPRLPLPTTKRPDDPLTGVRAPPTALWKLDFFVWSQVINTFFQACLCGFMWGMDRYARPSWSTGLFIALACIIAGLGGYVSFLEGKKVKRVEGVAAAAAAPQAEGQEEGERGLGLERTATRHEDVHVGEKGRRAHA